MNITSWIYYSFIPIAVNSNFNWPASSQSFEASLLNSVFCILEHESSSTRSTAVHRYSGTVLIGINFGFMVNIQIETWSFGGHFYRRSHSKTAKRAPHVHQTKTKHFIAKLFAQPSTPKTSFEFVWGVPCSREE